MIQLTSIILSPDPTSSPEPSLMDIPSVIIGYRQSAVYRTDGA
ncbi:hypothetical protein [Paenibacillus sp. ACRRY]|nr:hypothetical protein [Paenibacillus sp. ACRRY]